MIVDVSKSNDTVFNYVAAKLQGFPILIRDGKMLVKIMNEKSYDESFNAVTDIEDCDFEYPYPIKATKSGDKYTLKTKQKIGGRKIDPLEFEVEASTENKARILFALHLEKGCLEYDVPDNVINLTVENTNG